MDMRTDPGQAAPELPYQEITAPEYATLAARLFTVEDAGAGVAVLRGSCPRCGAVLEVPVVTDVFQGMRSLLDIVRRRGAAPLPGEHVEPMACTCADGHPNRPEGRVGCGAYWTLLLTAEPE
jgi:hypothetical protein